MPSFLDGLGSCRGLGTCMTAMVLIGRSGLPAYIVGRVLWDPIASSGLRSLVEAAAVLLAYPRASCQHIFGLSRSIASSKESQAFVPQGNNGEQRYLSWQCSSPTPGRLLLKDRVKDDA